MPMIFNKLVSHDFGLLKSALSEAEVMATAFLG
jgi:hypothetical protein